MTKEEPQLAGLIWSVANLLRGAYRPSDSGRILISFTVLRRLDCLLGDDGSPFKPHAPAGEITADAVRHYLMAFPPEVDEAFLRYGFPTYLDRLQNDGLLGRLVHVFAGLDLGREVVSDRDMGELFNDLLRRVVELSPSASGEHLTSPDVARLMARLLLAADTAAVQAPGRPLDVLDPACGTGGLLKAVEEEATRLNPEVDLSIKGQERSPADWALCRMWTILSGRDLDDVQLGNIFTEDRYADARFDCIIASPPFGVGWRNWADAVRAEHQHSGPSGRFGAGLPRTSDSSLLYLQHALAKMKPTGSRIAFLSTAASMWSGAAGSGESEIRRWIIENDWLEAIVALPTGVHYGTSIQTYVWTLTNRKPADRQGKVVLVDARDTVLPVRRPIGSKNRYLSVEQIEDIVLAHREASSDALPSDHHLHGKVRVLRNEELGYREILVEEPLRLRFELTDASLVRLAANRTIVKKLGADKVVNALRPIVGSVWGDEDAALTSIGRALTEGGAPATSPAFLRKVLRNHMWVRDLHGAVVRQDGQPEPDPELRRTVQFPLNADPDRYFRDKVLPESPDAWLDHSWTRVGYAISTSSFSQPSLDVGFVALSEYASLVTTSAERDVVDNQVRYLRAEDLHVVEVAVELPDVPDSAPRLTPCRGGDLVGRHGNWRLLPADFGEAVTSLFVLRIRKGGGRALGEWLNSRNDLNRIHVAGRDLDALLVPADLIDDDQVDNLLEEVQRGRRALRQATADLLPNVFIGGQRDMAALREEMRATAAQARLVGELVRPLVDPVGQAEWTYPFHVAALARWYRIATQPAERRDALLKLGEGIARVVGVLALSELLRDGRMSRKLRQEFYGGASFGTWLNLVDKFMGGVDAPRMRELAELRANEELRRALDEIRVFRNSTHHAHGVRVGHELEAEVDRLEPRVMTALTLANWLSGMQWESVDLCAYLDQNSYRLSGKRLRGSHPSWEPFERSSTYPVRPGRVYTGTTALGEPVDLWPLAVVELCTKCAAHELFLINEVRRGDVVLRSLEEHTIIVPLSAAFPAAEGS